ncbi:hypothetical protein ACJX0J_009562, partial [Zea mays]
ESSILTWHWGTPVFSWKMGLQPIAHYLHLNFVLAFTAFYLMAQVSSPAKSTMEVKAALVTLIGNEYCGDEDERLQGTVSGIQTIQLIYHFGILTKYT